MITKDEFIKYLNAYQLFEERVDRMGEAITGSTSNLFESDWYMAVDKMLATFLNSFLTEDGIDVVYYFMFEPIDPKTIIIKQEKDMFNEEEEVKYTLETLEDVWNFLLTDTKIYFKNA
jgi:hypothetical protein